MRWSVALSRCRRWAERPLASPFHPGAWRGRRDRRRPGGGITESTGQQPRRGGLEQRGERKVHTRRLVELREQTDGEQRMATKLEEIVAHADLFDSQEVLQQLTNPPLGLGLRRFMRRSLLPALFRPTIARFRSRAVASWSDGKV